MPTPPLRLLILDGLADDVETIETVRGHREGSPSGLALVDEQQDVLDGLRGLIADGLPASSLSHH